MNCNEYAEQIDLMVTGELGEEEQVSLHAHLEHCRDCRALFHTVVQIKQEARSEKMPYPASLDQRVMDRIDWIDDARSRSHSWKRVPWPIAIAAAFFLCATGFWVGRSLAPNPSPEIGRNTGSALVTNTTRIEVLYAIPAVEVVDYSTARTCSDSTLNK
ncbi:MAG: anti-sigma factor [Candidatus Zixiibacteriota bacterium]